MGVFVCKKYDLFYQKCLPSHQKAILHCINDSLNINMRSNIAIALFGPIIMCLWSLWDGVTGSRFLLKMSDNRNWWLYRFTLVE